MEDHIEEISQKEEREDKEVENIKENLRDIERTNGSTSILIIGDSEREN